jgi:hypothetical protein
MIIGWQRQWIVSLETKVQTLISTIVYMLYIYLLHAIFFNILNNYYIIHNINLKYY